MWFGWPLRDTTDDFTTSTILEGRAGSARKLSKALFSVEGAQAARSRIIERSYSPSTASISLSSSPTSLRLVHIMFGDMVDWRFEHHGSITYSRIWPSDSSLVYHRASRILHEGTWVAFNGFVSEGGYLFRSELIQGRTPVHK